MFVFVANFLCPISTFSLYLDHYFNFFKTFFVVLKSKFVTVFRCILIQSFRLYIRHVFAAHIDLKECVSSATVSPTVGLCLQ